MTGGAACTVCAHPRVAEIDADLSFGPTSGYTRIAGIYSLRKDAVRRHKMNGHVRPQGAGASSSPLPPPPEGADLGSIMPKSAVEILSQTLDELSKVDTAGMSARELNVHVDLKRKVAVDLAKYQVAVDREGPAQKELRALEEMVIAGDEALERFPEARKAVADAVRDWKARREAGEAEEGS
jgi:hypothetical protein